MERHREAGSTDLSDLVHVFDHELRTPLTVLRGHLEMIGDHLADLPDEVVSSLAVMARAVGRLEATVEGVAWLEQTAAELRPVG